MIIKIEYHDTGIPLIIIMKKNVRRIKIKRTKEKRNNSVNII